jgi:PPK2 family polyphosphate:nucleotide phosphotransferase
MRGQTTVMQGRVRLADFDPDYCGGLEKKDTKERTRKCAQRIAELQELLYANSRQALLLIFQGLDASGKDGAIRKVLHYVNPAGVQTAYFKVPTAEEKAHDFLWRVHREVPRYGSIGIFNRSHYEAVLAERVLLGLPPRLVKQRYRQIVEFERMLAENHVIVLKFFLHLGRNEQAKRFRERLEIPHKKWKFSSADLETRRRWDDFIEAYEDTLNATSHADARWHIVPSNHNWYRNHVVASTVVAKMESLHLQWPKPKEDLSKIRIK